MFCCSASRIFKGLVTAGLLGGLSLAFAAGDGKLPNTEQRRHDKLNPNGDPKIVLSRRLPKVAAQPDKFAKPAQAAPGIASRGPGASDDCANPTPITCGTSAVFSNATATTDAGDPLYPCAFGGAQQGAGSVWFSFVAADTEAKVSLCPGITGGLSDSLLAVWEGACGSLTLKACNDDFCGLLSEVCVTDLVIGNTYLIEVADWVGGAAIQGDFNLSLTCPCVSCVVCEPGDVQENEPDCGLNYDDFTNGGCNSNPPVYTDINCGDAICGRSGTFFHADPNDPNDPNLLAYRDTDWFRFTINSQQLVTWSATAEFPFVLFLINDGCPATIMASATGDACGSASISRCLAPGTYVTFIAPLVFDNVCGHLFRATLTCEECPPGPGNDSCDTPIDVTCGSSGIYTNAFATVEANDPNVSCAFGGPQIGAESVWFRVVPTTPVMRVSLCPGVGGLGDSLLSVHEGACGSMTEVACNDDSCGLLSEVVASVTPGNTYYIRVATWVGGGAVGGDFSLTVDCLQPLDNDACGGATLIACGSTGVYNNIGATTEPGDPNQSCSFGGASPNIGSVWFKFVATDVSARIDTCGAVGLTDTVVSVYDACGGAELACNDDSCGLLSRLCVEGLTVGNTYYIKVAAWNGTANTADDFNLTIACPCPLPSPNDRCEGALPVTPGTSVIGDTTGMTIDTDVVGNCGGGTITTPGVWYTVVGNGNQFSATTCLPGTTYDTKLNVYCGTCPTFFACVTGIDDDPNCALNGLFSTVSWCTAPGQTYYILVHGFGGATGPFELLVTDLGTPCVGPVDCTPPPPVANDSCSEAIAVAIGSSTAGSTLGAAADPTAPTCGTTISAVGVWYKVVGDGNTLTATTCNNTTSYDTKLNVYCGTCDSLTCVGGNDDGGDEACDLPPVGNNYESRVVWCSQLGATYYILVQGFGGASGNFQLDVISDATPCVATIQCLPVGACCIDGVCSQRTEIECDTLDGQYLGDGESCAQPGLEASYTNTPGLAIPDANPAGVSDVITATDTLTINNLEVNVQIPAHTWLGDLIITLSNGANTVTLWNRQCGSVDGLNVTFSDEGTAVVCASPTTGLRLPSTPLAVFDGQTPADNGGTWTLFVSDNAGADVGTLTSWSLRFIENGPDVCAELGCPLPGCVEPGVDCDFDEDCDVDLTDLAILLSNFGTPTGMTNATGDTDGDGDVDLTDLAQVLARFGSVCHPLP